MRIIRAQLEGADAEPGRVAAADVARIILGLERALTQAAYLVLRRKRRGGGRHKQVIADATRLRFVGIEPGSFVELLALPDADEVTADEMALPMAVPDLGSQALNRLMDVIEGRHSQPDDVELMSAIAQMAAELGIGDRNTSITLSHSEAVGSPSVRSVTINQVVRSRMQHDILLPAAVRDQTLVGTLFEADFERNTARLRLSTGTVVEVVFPADLADDVHEALRLKARLEGIVEFNARTAEVKSVYLRAVSPGEQLALDADTFWRSPTFFDLQEAQGTTGRVNVSDMVIEELTDDERAAFLGDCDQ